MKKRLLSLGTGGVSKTDESSEKCQRGWGSGVIFNPKIYFADFGHLNSVCVGRFPKKMQYKFSKMRGEGGSKAVWNISENSPVLETLPVPYVCFGVI